MTTLAHACHAWACLEYVMRRQKWLTANSVHGLIILFVVILFGAMVALTIRGKNAISSIKRVG